ncbi:uncharacterized protein TNCV_1676331 [Trichonephila clavipes]|nr:uncharacterized protein TNCV_1676331 [Trichonephila clavipes]
MPYLGGKGMGPFVFGEPTVTGSAYIYTLQLWLLPQLKESEPDNFIWQQDGSQPHWHLSVRNWLNITVLDQWNFHKGPHDKACFAWPPCSSDLTLHHFYLWGFVKDYVYIPPLPSDLPDSRHRIEAAVPRIASDTLNKVWDELTHQLDVCCVTNEAHIEHL